MDKFIPTPPAPPSTGDPVTWIAVALVCVLIAALVLGIPWLLKTVREERGETLKAFREEMAAERKAHAEAVAELRKDHAAAHDRLHERLDGVDDRLVEIVKGQP